MGSHIMIRLNVFLQRSRMKNLSRRDVLGPLGIAAGSCMLSSCLSGNETPAADQAKASDRPWTYHELDPDITAARAYDDHAKGHCMYGVFSSVITQLSEEYGEPYRSFPVGMMHYGGGGTGSSGSLCGALNGSAALIGLFVQEEEEMKQLVAEMFLWYEQTLLPTYSPATPGLDVEIPKSISNSILCHASATFWCKVAGHKTSSKPRKERCRRLTADTARKTVHILNSYHHDRFAPLHQSTEEVKECQSCHTKGSEKENSKGTMSCGSCHFSPTDTHPPIDETSG